jgi:5-formyltetrahydrofolate cyclo-ligase
MIEDIRERKAALRQRLKHSLAAVTRAEVDAASMAARARLKQQQIWATAGRVLFFAPMGKEIDLGDLLVEALGEQRLVALPRYRPDRDEYEAARISNPVTDLIPGKRGILEPTPECAGVPLNQLDLALVSGLGFDSGGRRLGRGRGYYDRLLSRASGVFCGVAMDAQIVPFIPAESHDIILDCILTPTRWVACSPRAV